MSGTKKCRCAVVAALILLLAPGGLLAQQQTRGLSLDDALLEMYNFRVNPWWRLPLSGRVRELTYLAKRSVTLKPAT